RPFGERSRLCQAAIQQYPAEVFYPSLCAPPAMGTLLCMLKDDPIVKVAHECRILDLEFRDQLEIQFKGSKQKWGMSSAPLRTQFNGLAGMQIWHRSLLIQDAARLSINVGVEPTVELNPQ